MFKWPIILGTLFAILLGVLFGGSSANALSLTNPPVMTDELLLGGDTETTSCNIEDLTLQWNRILTDDSYEFYYKNAFGYNGTGHDNFVTEYEDNLTTGSGWGVTQSLLFNSGSIAGGAWGIPFDDYNKMINIYVWNPSDTFTVTDGILTNDNASFTILRLFLNQNASCRFQIWTSQSSLSSINMEIEKFLFMATDNITYPSEYENDEIPATLTPPTPPLNWSPDVNMVNVIDWKITLQDQNFNTFDSVPFTCDQGLTPVIEYDLYNNDTDPITLLTTGVFSPTVPFEFQSEKYETETEYKFIGSYYCGDGINTFSHQTTYYFTVNAAGTYVPPTDSCYTDTFPYIDLNGCTGVLENFLNNLSFGAISFPNWSINKDSCHTLGIIGDWLNVPASSRTICPQFPSEIRNIVTPFLTFILGITILGVIVTKSRSDTH